MSCGFGVDEGNNPVNTVVVVILIVCDRVAEVAVLGTGERFAICQFLRIFVTQNIAAWINGSCFIVVGERFAILILLCEHDVRIIFNDQTCLVVVCHRVVILWIQQLAVLLHIGKDEVGIENIFIISGGVLRLLAAVGRVADKHPLRFRFIAGGHGDIACGAQVKRAVKAFGNLLSGSGFFDAPVGEGIAVVALGRLNKLAVRHHSVYRFSRYNYGSQKQAR